jgi:hypothetical protein
MYELVHPCDSGLFIGSCGASDIMLVAFVFETWIVYIAIALISVFIERKIHKSISIWLYGVIGGLVAALLFFDIMHKGITSNIMYYFFLGLVETWSKLFS